MTARTFYSTVSEAVLAREARMASRRAAAQAVSKPELTEEQPPKPRKPRKRKKKATG